MMQFLSPESTRAGDRVECGDTFPRVPAGLEGQLQLEECVKGKKAWARPRWSSVGNKSAAHETEEGTRGNLGAVGFGSRGAEL